MKNPVISIYDKKLTTKEQHQKIATQEKMWAASALRDAKYNLKQARTFETQGKHVLAEMYMQEYRWCIFWYNRRMKVAMQHEAMARK